MFLPFRRNQYTNKEPAMPATLVTPSTTSTRRIAKPISVALAVATNNLFAERHEGTQEAIRAMAQADNHRLQLVREVMLEMPAAARLAVEASGLAAKANEAYREGHISLDVRNRYATKASTARRVIMDAAQGYLDRVNGGGYIAESGIPELHRVV